MHSALSKIDVPPRTSYVMAVLIRRSAGITSVPRMLAAALGPMLAGSLLAATGFAWPMTLGGGLKIVRDLLQGTTI